MNILTPKIESLLDKGIPVDDESKVKVRKYRPVRVKYKGKFVITPSGKTVWKLIGHCKAAINNMLDGMSWDYSSKTPWKRRWDRSSMLREELEKKGLLEYIYLNEADDI